MPLLDEREKILAIDLARRRPPSLRRAARHSAADAAAICKSESAQARLILLTANSVEGLGIQPLHLPSDAELEEAFRRSRTLHEMVTLRLAEAVRLTHEDRPQARNIEALCELRLVDEDDLKEIPDGIRI